MAKLQPFKNKTEIKLDPNPYSKSKISINSSWKGFLDTEEGNVRHKNKIIDLTG